jgi:L-cysteine/cystine lyase
MPNCVQEALVAVALKELNAGRIVPGVYEGSGKRNARVRELIALTHSTSEGLSTVLMGLDWELIDEIMTTTLEHAGLLVPLCLLAHATVSFSATPRLGTAKSTSSPRSRRS